MLINAANRRNQEYPEHIQKAPSLLPGLELYYEAFVELSTCRSLGLNIGPIPWTAINDYGIRHNFLDEEFDYLVIMVRGLDDAFLKFVNAKKPGVDNG